MSGVETSLGPVADDDEGDGEAEVVEFEEDVEDGRFWSLYEFSSVLVFDF